MRKDGLDGSWEGDRMRVAILTISDRSSRGEREDLSGPLIRKRVETQGWDVIRADIVADDRDGVEKTLLEMADSGEVDLILTTGGTGFSPRDQAPEATQAVVERAAPGLVDTGPPPAAPSSGAIRLRPPRRSVFEE